MSEVQADGSLLKALKLSHDILAAAELADVAQVALLDVERMRLVVSFRQNSPRLGAADNALLGQISQLNDKAIGLLEHQLRARAREIDLAKTGRRAVAAYASTR